jgi:beta-galactosidase
VAQGSTQAQGRGRRGKKEKPPTATARTGRLTLSLDGAWTMTVEPDTRGMAPGSAAPLPPGGSDVTVPFSASGSAAGKPPASVWYFRKFGIPAAWKGQTIRLMLGAVAQKSTVWLNGQLLGSSNDSAAPQVYDITGHKLFYASDQTTPVSDNVLAVRASGSALGAPGIWQHASLISHDEAYLADCAVLADRRGHVTATITLQNTSSKSGDATLDAKIVTGPDHKLVVQTLQNLALTPGRNITTLLVTIPSEHLRIWSPANPTLYALQLNFHQQTDVLDTLDTVFGCREIGVNGDALTIDDSPVPGSTLALHEFDAPNYTDPSIVRTRLRYNQNSGVGMVYLEAPAPAVLDVADQVGMVVCEAPRAGLSPEAARSELLALIVRDRSHPSVAMWNLDSCLTQSEGQPALVAAVRKLDPTRALLIGSKPLWP